MAWTSRVFRSHDIWVLIGGLILLQLLAFLLVNRLMFHPVKNGYDETLTGFVDIGTNGVSIAARIIRPPNCKKIIMYCHGNAEDLTVIDERFDDMIGAGYAIATFDYPGYGLSDGSPNEEGCYRNAHRMFDWLVERGGFSTNEIFVVGYSIGTGVAVELASSLPIARLWLEAPYLSAPRVVTRIRLLIEDPFPNYSRIGSINCPLVIMHGTDDEIVPFSQGKALFDLAKQPKTFVAVHAAGHSDFIDAFGAKNYARLMCAFFSMDGDWSRLFSEEKEGE